MVALHERGFHRTWFLARCAPNGLHVRLFVGRDEEKSGAPLRTQDLDRIVYLSVDDSEQAVREFAGVLIPAWWGRDRVADLLLSAFPPMSPAGDDAVYQREIHDLLNRHSVAGTLPLTDNGGNRPA